MKSKFLFLTIALLSFSSCQTKQNRNEASSVVSSADIQTSNHSSESSSVISSNVTASSNNITTSTQTSNSLSTSKPSSNSGSLLSNSQSISSTAINTTSSITNSNSTINSSSSSLTSTSSSTSSQILTSASTAISSSVSSNSISQSTSSTSQSSTISSSSTIPEPPIEEFCFSESEITIDISSSHFAFLRIINTFNVDENISWIVPHSNVIRLEKVTTKHNEENMINALSVGNIRLKGEANGKITYCDVYVINSAKKPEAGTANISIYAINDYHGTVSNEFSIKHLGTFIKQKVNQANTLFLDQGDTFQGSLKSNYNYGRMITDVYNAAGMSARTVGNHDFDWGRDKLIANTNANYHGYSTPVLAANVYDYNFTTKEVGSTQQEEIGKPYVTFTLESGIKVGVIGTIGTDCITSICTPFVQDIHFIDVSNTIKNLSDILRSQENCDVVIASIHEGLNYNVANKITSVSPVSHKKYVDLVLNSHTHAYEIEEYNEVTFAQFGSNGQAIGKINLTFDYSTEEIISTNTYTLTSSSLISDVPLIDTEINSIVNNYEEQVEEMASEVLTEHLSGTFSSNEHLPNLVCRAMYEASINQGFDISYAVANKARQNLYGEIVTYESLYTSLPFDNVIYIINVLGEELANELGFSSNSMYRGYNSDALAPIQYAKTYTIACLDYVAFHCNCNREYNYFPSLKVVGYLTKNDEAYTYREVTADFLRNTSGTISSNDYNDFSSPRFNTSLLDQDISI